jgi:D-cysteine desulfhydrase
MNLTKFPRRRYTQGQTPIELLPRISNYLNGPNIYIKRDDLLGLTAGGNKTRKLEFLVADALAQGADTLVTTGAVQSNHCRLTLAAAVKEGLKCHLVLEERVPDSYNEQASGNNFLFKLLGADSITVVPGGADLLSSMEKVADDIRSTGGVPYIVPGGGSNARGALGYVSCASEILTQSFESGIQFDHVVCSSGSGGTHAGLVAGLHTMSAQIPVTGISVRAEKAPQETKIHKLANSILELADIKSHIPESHVTVLDEYVGPGYSLPTKEMTEAIQLFARTEGILLDPVYTGKTAAGLVGMIRSGVFGKGENVLLIHTGGAPALYAHRDEALNGS